MAFWQRNTRVPHRNNESGHWTRYAANSIQLPSTQPIPLKVIQYYFQIFSKSYTLSTSKKIIFQMSVIIFFFLTFVLYVQLITAYPFSRPKNSNLLIHGEESFLRNRWLLRESLNSTLFTKHRDKFKHRKGTFLTETL